VRAAPYQKRQDAPRGLGIWMRLGAGRRRQRDRYERVDVRRERLAYGLVFDGRAPALQHHRARVGPLLRGLDCFHQCGRRRRQRF
jgi:hypothetical protein